MTMSRRTALAALAGAALASWMAVAEANDRTVFSGCVTAHDDKSSNDRNAGVGFIGSPDHKITARSAR